MADDLLNHLLTATGAGDDFERGQAKLAAQAIADGSGTPDKVTAKLQATIHAHRADLGKQPSGPEYNDVGSDIAGGISSAYQGLTAGLGNKITAGIRSGLPGALEVATGIPRTLTEKATGLGGDYGQNLKEQTDVLDQFRQRHPVASTALQIAGSIPTAGVGGVPKTLGGMAKLGAGFGGVSGGAEAIRPGATVGDVAEGAGEGALTGAVAAPVIGATVGVLPKAVEHIARMMGKTPPAAELADNILGSAAARAGVTPASLPNDATTTLMDVGGPAVTKVVRAARNVPTSTAEGTTTDFLQQRAADTADRLHTALTVGTGHAPEEAWMTNEQLQGAKTAAAKPAYDKAFQSPSIPLTAHAGEGGPTLDELLQRPSAQSAVNYADKLNAEEGATPLSDKLTQQTTVPGVDAKRLAELRAQGLDKFLPSGTSTERATNVSVQDLHNLKLRMDDIIGYAKRNGTTIEGTAATKGYLRAVEQTKNQLLDIMDAHAPDYQTARHGFAGASSVQDALSQGADDFAASVRPSEVAANRAALGSNSEREFYDRGMLSAARDVIEKNAANPDLPAASKNVNLVQRLLGNKQQAEKIRGLFPDAGSYQAFINQMEHEAQYPVTSKALLNQSTTAGQQAERNMTPSAWTAIDAGRAVMGSPSAMVRTGIKAARALGSRAQGISPEVANEIGQRATVTGPALRALVQRYAVSQAPRQAATATARVISGNAGAITSPAIRQLANQP